MIDIAFKNCLLKYQELLKFIQEIYPTAESFTIINHRIIMLPARKDITQDLVARLEKEIIF